MEQHIGGSLHDNEMFPANRGWTQAAPDAFPAGDSKEPRQVLLKKKDRIATGKRKVRNRKRMVR